MHEIRFLPGHGRWVWPGLEGKEDKIVELAQQVTYPIKVVLVVDSRSRAFILGLDKRRKNTKYIWQKKLQVYFIMASWYLSLNLILLNFFVVGVHNFSFSVWIYWSKLIKLVPAGK